ncbi:MAG TPA: prepilin-type N-terminal cleavage/methylation domain-containing protein [Bryobacteraceae bacterium]|nr:prepilin-type N-terminal cleavage/methylation domain-containing protein [Bryobacteraceae bacterium]
MRKRRRAGVTLLEVLVAVTLLSLLTVAMLFAMRIGLNTYAKTNDKLMADRRVGGAQKILSEEIEGLAPVTAPCAGMPVAADFGPALGGQQISFFEGQPAAMRFVSTFSLQLGWRGEPQILELAVIPGDEDRGVRLVVNEVPYTGTLSAGRFCLGFAPDPLTGVTMPQFAAVAAGPQSFVLADKLAYCRFTYLSPAPQAGMPPVWTASWSSMGWPRGVKVEMAPLETGGTRLQPITVVAPVRLFRNPGSEYAD